MKKADLKKPAVKILKKLPIMLSCSRKEFREHYLLKKNLFASRNNRHVTFVISFSLKLNFSVSESKKSMVFSKPYIQTRIMLGSSLAYYNVASFDSLAAEKLDAQSFTLRIATVT
jgi:hypothetical protein